MDYYKKDTELDQYPGKASSPTLLPMNGRLTFKKTFSYLSMKVKFGHQRVEDDAIAVIDARNGGQMATEDGINLTLYKFRKCLGSTILALLATFSL